MRGHFANKQRQTSADYIHTNPQFHDLPLDFHHITVQTPKRMLEFDTEYDRANVPPYNGNDPPPAPGSLKRSLFPTLFFLNEVQNKGTQGVRARYGAELPPIISIVRYPGRPVISVPEEFSPPTEPFSWFNRGGHLLRQRTPLLHRVHAKGSYSAKGRVSAF